MSRAFLICLFFVTMQSGTRLQAQYVMPEEQAIELDAALRGLLENHREQKEKTVRSKTDNTDSSTANSSSADADNRATGNRATGNRATDNRATDSRATDSRVSGGLNPDGPNLDGPNPDSTASDTNSQIDLQAEAEYQSGSASPAELSRLLNEDDNSAAADAMGIERLALSDVVASFYRSYPDIARARQQGSLAAGELTSAYGAFDHKLKGHSLSEPTGFYENYRHTLSVARQTWYGDRLYAGYKLGRGTVQPWFQERQSNEAGEIKLRIERPLLRGRAIDAQRVGVLQARLQTQAAAPIVQQTILDTARDAVGMYWKWVAAGAVLQAQRELYAIADRRNEQFKVGVKAGKFAPIDLILNQQLLAERSAKLLETEQKFRGIGLKLSLFLRDESGNPMVPRDEWLPKQFPLIELPQSDGFHEDLAAALARRPELRLLELERQSVDLERRLARNNTLPNIHFVLEGSQDAGKQSSSLDDKGNFELVIGVQGEYSIQRRKAHGKIQSTTAKIIQIEQKTRLTRDKIGAELRAARNSLVLSTQVVQQSEISLRAALVTLEKYRFAFTKGKIDLIYLNLLEMKANETEIKLVEAQRTWFDALSIMQATLGLDPLEQALNVSALPPSELIGPGNLGKSFENSIEANR